MPESLSIDRWSVYELAIRIPLWGRWAFCGIYLAAIAALSLVSPSSLPSAALGWPGADKVAHFVMYGGLGALLRWALHGGRKYPGRWHVALAGAILYGWMMEVLQANLTYGMRAFEWSDVAANTVGCLVFWRGVGGWLDRRATGAACSAIAHAAWKANTFQDAP